MFVRQAVKRSCFLLFTSIGIGSVLCAAEPLGGFLTSHCLHCHGPDNQEGELRIDLLSRDFKSGGEAHRWAEVIERVNSREMPPEGEPQPTQDEIGAFVIKLDSLIKEGRAARMAARPAVSHYRLSRKEYQNTVYDPLVSSVPVAKRGTDAHPAENHAILLEDEPSYCLREGKVWRLQEVEIQDRKGTVVANRGPQDGAEDQESEQQMTIDAATRIWRGRERLAIEDLIAEGVWPASGKKSLDGQLAHLGISWKPAGTWARRVGSRFHISAIWLDETAMQRAGQQQTEVHKSLIRSRWMPAWVDTVEYGKFGHATVTATLFGGMDPSLYGDFKKGTQGQIGASELTLKHSSGNYGQGHMAIKGPIVDVTKSDDDVPLGSSGIQISIKVDLVLEGFRPGRIVRIRPLSWPDDAPPREEFHVDGNMSHEERFPTPDIFPKYE